MIDHHPLAPQETAADRAALARWESEGGSALPSGESPRVANREEPDDETTQSHYQRLRSERFDPTNV
jgi:hypothetical protein